jgi:hypothetical protein
LFQYAACRALALRNGAELVLDTTSGFARDRVFRRTYLLDGLRICARHARRLEQLGFLAERLVDRLPQIDKGIVRWRPWGTLVTESEPRFFEEAARVRILRTTWIDGYWQSEQYFSECALTIASEVSPPPPLDSEVRGVAQRIAQTCNSVAICVRVFEDIPGPDKSSVGGMVPFSFYEASAAQLAEAYGDCRFFVFSTSDTIRALTLPGQVTLLTPTTLPATPLGTLWLLSHCRHFVISNSSFYWWGAWLAEQHGQARTIIAPDSFPNPSTIPPRWCRVRINRN